ncbi:MAG: methyltransferase domain-containing protein [Gemmatimonadetes bacterium]|nr:methyltransferase domain-containing protein [Gemmatimonadota bacterium]
MTPTHDIVRDYYGEQLKSSADLRTSACCDPEVLPDYLKAMLGRIHPEVTARYYGCGLVAPTELRGKRVIDLGCGSGRDVYLLAQLVGPEGEVVGVDMTPSQLAVAREHEEFHRQQFGFARSNVRFVDGQIESLDQLGLGPGSFDVVVSNCVVNLATDKGAVLRGAARLLRAGGEMYFADVYADRRVPEAVRQDPLLYGECLGGAQYWNDFLDAAKDAGFRDPRLVADRPLSIDDTALAARVGPLRFFSATYRLFKIDALESQCEDYGQAVIYRGTIEGSQDRFILDKHHDIETGKVFPVCGNTWRMLRETRFASHFAFIGDFSRHYGVFAGCGGGLPFATGTTPSSSCC